MTNGNSLYEMWQKLEKKEYFWYQVEGPLYAYFRDECSNPWNEKLLYEGRSKSS